MKLREAGLPPPHQILTDHRMREARCRLQGGSCRIEELAEACGFRSGRAFTKTFAARHGVSPMKWKKLKTTCKTENLGQIIPRKAARETPAADRPPPREPSGEAHDPGCRASARRG